MHHYVIDGDTGGKRISPVIEKVGDGVVVPDELMDQLVQLEGRDTRFQHLGYFRQRTTDQPCTVPHQFYFRCCFIMYHILFKENLLGNNYLTGYIVKSLIRPYGCKLRRP